MGKKGKVRAANVKAANAAPISKAAKRAAIAASKEERRARKLAVRKNQKKGYTADMWAEPAPSHLVAKLDIPRVKSKYQSYFEFAANPEKKEKRLEFKASLFTPLTRSQLIHRRSPTMRTHLQASCSYLLVTRY